MAFGWQRHAWHWWVLVWRVVLLPSPVDMCGHGHSLPALLLPTFYLPAWPSLHDLLPTSKIATACSILLWQQPSCCLILFELSVIGHVLCVPPLNSDVLMPTNGQAPGAVLVTVPSLNWCGSNVFQPNMTFGQVGDRVCLVLLAATPWCVPCVYMLFHGMATCVRQCGSWWNRRQGGALERTRDRQAVPPFSPFFASVACGQVGSVPDPSPFPIIPFLCWPFAFFLCFCLCFCPLLILLSLSLLVSLSCEGKAVVGRQTLHSITAANNMCSHLFF